MASGNATPAWIIEERIRQIRSRMAAWTRSPRIGSLQDDRISRALPVGDRRRR